MSYYHWSTKYLPVNLCQYECDYDYGSYDKYRYVVLYGYWVLLGTLPMPVCMSPVISIGIMVYVVIYRYFVMSLGMSVGVFL